MQNAIILHLYIYIYLFLNQNSKELSSYLRKYGGLGTAADQRMAKFACCKTQIFINPVLRTGDLIFAVDVDL